MDHAGRRPALLEGAFENVADQAGEIETEDKNSKRGKQLGSARDKKRNKLIKIRLHLLSPS
jgi:hypothetical protein